MTGHDDPRPQPPVEPGPVDCCGEGCARCIFDVHDEKMERYRAALAAWQARQGCAEERDPGASAE